MAYGLLALVTLAATLAVWAAVSFGQTLRASTQSASTAPGSGGSPHLVEHAGPRPR